MVVLTGVKFKLVRSRNWCADKCKVETGTK